MCCVCVSPSLSLSPSLSHAPVCDIFPLKRGVKRETMMMVRERGTKKRRAMSLRSTNINAKSVIMKNWSASQKFNLLCVRVCVWFKRERRRMKRRATPLKGMHLCACIIYLCACTCVHVRVRSIRLSFSLAISLSLCVSLSLTYRPKANRNTESLCQSLVSLSLSSRYIYISYTHLLEANRNNWATGIIKNDRLTLPNSLSLSLALSS